MKYSEIKKIIEENPELTREQIGNLIGKSPTYVSFFKKFMEKIDNNTIDPDNLTANEKAIYNLFLKEKNQPIPQNQVEVQVEELEKQCNHKLKRLYNITYKIKKKYLFYKHHNAKLIEDNIEKSLNINRLTNTIAKLEKEKLHVEQQVKELKIVYYLTICGLIAVIAVLGYSYYILQ